MIIISNIEKTRCNVPNMKNNLKPDAERWVSRATLVYQVYVETEMKNTSLNKIQKVLRPYVAELETNEHQFPE